MGKKRKCPLNQDIVRQLSNEFGFQELQVNPKDREFKMRFANNRVKYVDVFFSTGTVRLEEKDSRKDTHTNVTVSQMRDIFEKFAVKLQQPDVEEEEIVTEEKEGLFNNNSSKLSSEPRGLTPDSIRSLAEKYSFEFEEKSHMILLTGPNDFLINVFTNSATVVIQNPQKPAALKHSPCSLVQLDEFLKNICDIHVLD